MPRPLGVAGIAPARFATGTITKCSGERRRLDRQAASDEIERENEQRVGRRADRGGGEQVAFLIPERGHGADQPRDVEPTSGNAPSAAAAIRRTARARAARAVTPTSADRGRNANRLHEHLIDGGGRRSNRS